MNMYMNYCTHNPEVAAKGEPSELEGAGAGPEADAARDDLCIEMSLVVLGNVQVFCSNSFHQLDTGGAAATRNTQNNKGWKPNKHVG